MIRKTISLLFFIYSINAQIALPTFQAVHKPHTTTSSGTFTFTNCDAIGRDGPSQSDCNSEYLGTSLEGLVTVSSGIQTWTVPSTATYTIEVWGAQGGGAGADNTAGGLGAYLKVDFNLSAGDVIKILVGQAGATVNYAGGGGTLNGGSSGNGGGGGSYNSSSANTASNEGAREGHGQVVITF